MTLPATTGNPSPIDARRALHDRLERAYLALARESDRFFAEAHAHGTFTGFAGLDAETMNRVVHVNATTDADVDALLEAAGAFFDARRVPWSVQLTPYAGPADFPRALVARGFRPTAPLGVMVLEAPAGPVAPRGVTVAEADASEAGAFTRVVLEAFRMPERYFPALSEVTQSWLAAGGRAFLARRDGEVVGGALLTRADGVHGVYNVGTRRAHRRRGVATALMTAVLDAFREDPAADVLTLQVTRDSTAERLYERLGFRHAYDWTVYVPSARPRASARGPG